MNPNFPPQATPITLYRHPKSGHSHRAELMLALLGLPYRTVNVDLANGAHKTPEFRALNPFGQVPVIDDNGTVVSDSNAILVYLARQYPDGHDWLPERPRDAAEVQRWLSIAAGEIAAGPCAARLVTVFAAPLDHAAARARAHDLFGAIEPLLAARDFLTGIAPTLADVAAYSYIAHAPEGGVPLAPYPAIRAWLARIEALPRFVGMARSPCADAA